MEFVIEKKGISGILGDSYIYFGCLYQHQGVFCTARTKKQWYIGLLDLARIT